MSIRAITSVFDADIKPASVKFVLVALADCADDELVCWPSIAAIAQKTSLDRKTVILCIERLEQMGLLADTGQRKGQTMQVKVYRLTIPKAEQYRNRNSSDSPGKESRFSVGTVPKAVHGTVIESSEPKSTRPKGRSLIPVDFKITDATRIACAPHDQYLDLHLEYFIDYANANGKMYKDWNAAFRNCVRNDWGNVRKNAKREGTAVTTKPRVATVKPCACGEPGTVFLFGAMHCSLCATTKNRNAMQEQHAH